MEADHEGWFAYGGGYLRIPAPAGADLLMKICKTAPMHGGEFTYGGGSLTIGWSGTYSRLDITNVPKMNTYSTVQYTTLVSPGRNK
jgi:hypothetical protein